MPVSLAQGRGSVSLAAMRKRHDVVGPGACGDGEAGHAMLLDILPVIQAFFRHRVL